LKEQLDGFIAVHLFLERNLTKKGRRGQLAPANYPHWWKNSFECTNQFI